MTAAAFVPLLRMETFMSYYMTSSGAACNANAEVLRATLACCVATDTGDYPDNSNLFITVIVA